MEIQAVTTFSYEIFKDFTRFNYVKGKNYKLKQWLIWALAIFVPVGTVIFYLYYFDISDFEYLLYLFLELALFAFIYLKFYYSFFFPQKIYKSSKKLQNLQQHYVFKEDEFTLNSSNPECSSNAVIKYSMLFNAYETEKYFYFYIQSNQAYIVDKSGIINGTADQIRVAVLRSLPTGKYIICK